MRKLLAAMCILLVSSTSWAQNKSSSWDNLRTLQAGEKIQVRAFKSKKITGDFLSVSDTTIQVQTEEGSQTIHRQDVRSVKLAKHQHRLRNALILAGVGAGAGAGIGAAAHHGCSASQTFCLDIGGRSLPAGIGAVVGFLGGAAVGALLPSHETVYSATAH